MADALEQDQTTPGAGAMPGAGESPRTGELGAGELGAGELGAEELGVSLLTDSTATSTTNEQGEANNGEANKGETNKGETLPGSKGKEQTEAYTFTPVAGATYSAEDLQTYAGQAKAMGLTQEQAQQVLELGASNQKAALRAHEKEVEAWAVQVKNDPELGGTNFQGTVASAQLALRHVDPQGTVQQMLRETGYGNHPEVIRLFKRVHEALGEDVFTRSQGSGASEKPLWERLYNNK